MSEVEYCYLWTQVDDNPVGIIFQKTGNEKIIAHIQPWIHMGIPNISKVHVDQFISTYDNNLLIQYFMDDLRFSGSNHDLYLVNGVLDLTNLHKYIEYDDGVERPELNSSEMCEVVFNAITNNEGAIVQDIRNIKDEL